MINDKMYDFVLTNYNLSFFKWLIQTKSIKYPTRKKCSNETDIVKEVHAVEIKPSYVWLLCFYRVNFSVITADLVFRGLLCFRKPNFEIAFISLFFRLIMLIN